MSEKIPSGDIANAMGLTQDQLFELIGNEESLGANIRSDDPKKLIELGMAWWTKKESELRPVICHSGVVRRLAEGPTLDIAQAIYAAIFPELGVELAIYASALIAKSGISNWCDVIWHER
ncbi:hypothetical protein BSZ21_05815 [Bradyrhizobium canariense]|uniref:hypothetical protein n=1 Tax=Bradyrhizobium canariense TaxID=255045 RepID=UPI000A239938|nr:hypothetical protein [Bradyrhizobium canariense]OSI74425.1 hypothetical protein BSZ21_05815 [Bradyrhizobium canariense]